MRNDIEELFAQLNTFYTDKVVYYKRLKNNSSECNFHAVSRNFSKIDELLAEGSVIIDDIDRIDFEIAQLKSKICSKSGIQYHLFENYFLSNPVNNTTQKMKELMDILKPLIRESLENRDKLIVSLKTEKSQLSSSISSFARMRALNTRFQVLNY